MRYLATAFILGMAVATLPALLVQLRASVDVRIGTLGVIPFGLIFGMPLGRWP